MPVLGHKSSVSVRYIYTGACDFYGEADEAELGGEGRREGKGGLEGKDEKSLPRDERTASVGTDVALELLLAADRFDHQVAFCDLRTLLGTALRRSWTSAVDCCVRRSRPQTWSVGSSYRSAAPPFPLRCLGRLWTSIFILRTHDCLAAAASGVPGLHDARSGPAAGDDDAAILQAARRATASRSDDGSHAARKEAGHQAAAGRVRDRPGWRW